MEIEHLQQMIAHSDKKRHELENGKIRAAYGHSIAGRIHKEPAVPPNSLYHGTSPDVLINIQKNGLLPMHRQYVHLSADKATARSVGLRKHNRPILLEIKAKDAMEKGAVAFYRGNEQVWLSDSIPSEFIIVSTQ